MMSHAVIIKMIANQEIKINGKDVNIHEIDTIIVNGSGEIFECIRKEIHPKGTVVPPEIVPCQSDKQSIIKEGIMKMIYKKFILLVPEKENYCYRYGCNHWYLCIQNEDDSYKECKFFIGDEDKANYDVFRID